MALIYAHTQCVIAARAPDDLLQLSEEAVATRDRLHADVQTLAARGLINPSALKDFRGLKGYKIRASVAQSSTTWQLGAALLLG